MSETKKRNIWLPTLFSIVLILGIFIGFELKEKTGYGYIFSKTSPASVTEVLKLIQSRYVEDVPLDSISTNVINQLLASLDPHSSYIPADELAEMNDEIMGNFQGIGIEYQLINDSLNVINVLSDGPAKKAGIQVGDIFLTANDTVLLSGTKANHEDIRKQLRGQVATTLKIKLLRNNKTIVVPIQRDIITIPSVDAAYIAAPQTGYIHINKFTEQTHQEFMKSLDSLQKQKMTKLILDLRGNGGGLMEAAANIADEFLSGEKLIVYTEGAHSKRINYTCKKDGMFEEGKLVVLVDETSASASEVLTGALQDWDRATIIGRRSFGKGLVQQQFSLSDGSAVRLTTAKYYTPLGRNIQKPYLKNKEQYKEEIFNRVHQAKDNYDSTKLSTKTYKTPAGHTVYGGGGITPDMIVPFDTTVLHSAAYKLMDKDNLNTFAYHWYLQHRSLLDNLKDINNLQSFFDSNNVWWNDLISFTNTAHINILPCSEKEKKSIELSIEYFVSRVVLNKSAAMQVINQNDETINKALQVIK